MSALTPEQWAAAGEYALRLALSESGLRPSEADIADARDAAVWIATGKHISPAEPAPQEKRMNDQSIEQQIQAKGLTAPRITPADVEAEIAGEYYASGAGAFSNNTMPNAHYSTLNLLTFCVLILRNGHKVVGINHGPIDPANFDAACGRKDARNKAIEKIWPLLGFRLRDELARPVLTEADAAADLAGTPRPV